MFGPAVHCCVSERNKRKENKKKKTTNTSKEAARMDEASWTLREKLLLVEAVQKGGSHWASVSRVMRQHIAAQRTSQMFNARVRLS